MQTFKQCRHRWQWAFAERRQPILPPLALSFGDLVHLALAAYYIPGRKRGELPANTFTKLYEDQDERLRGAGWLEDDEEWVEAGELGVRMLEAYVEFYAEADKQFCVISSEQTFHVVLRNPRTRRRFIFVGTLDGVWEDLSAKKGDNILFAEHKTAKAIATDGLALDDQASGYWTYAPKWLRLAGILRPGQLPTRILYNYLRKAARNPEASYDELGRKLNKDGSVSKQQPAPYFVREPVYRDDTDRRRFHERTLCVVEEISAVEAQVASGNLGVAYKNSGPQHLPNCRGCPFRDPCELHETGNGWKIMLDEMTQPWDPYDAHHKVERR